MASVTVLLRTLDAASYLPGLLEMLRMQTYPPREILVVDSGSRDATVALAEEAGARVVHLPPAEFTHARSTNLGFAQARGEVVAMLSQDALPCSGTWLQELTAPLADPRVVAAFGRQVPRPGCFPLEAWHIREAYPETPPPGVVYSNVNSAARVEAWREVPFDEGVRIAEDRLWAREQRRRGKTVAYVPSAAVWHSHTYTLRGVYHRCREEARMLRDREGRRESWGLLVKAWPRQTLRDRRRLAAEGAGRLWPRAAAYRFAQYAGMIAGGRS